jgi:hypothetical protein
MTLAGAQVREARELLGWSIIKLAIMTNLGMQRIKLVESDDWLRPRTSNACAPSWKRPVSSSSPRTGVARECG